MDNLRFVTWLLVMGLVFVALAGAALAWANRGSQTVVVAYATLVATMVLFGLNLVFQLRSSVTEQAVGAQVLLNVETREVLPFHNGFGFSFAHHREAVDWLREHNPAAFTDDKRVAGDLIIYSFVRFLGSQEIDW